VYHPTSTRNQRQGGFVMVITTGNHNTRYLELRQDKLLAARNGSHSEFSNNDKIFNPFNPNF
jgi:hypothetical protein